MNMYTQASSSSFIASANITGRASSQSKTQFWSNALRAWWTNWTQRGQVSAHHRQLQAEVTFAYERGDGGEFAHLHTQAHTLCHQGS